MPFNLHSPFSCLELRNDACTWNTHLATYGQKDTHWRWPNCQNEEAWFCMQLLFSYKWGNPRLRDVKQSVHGQLALKHCSRSSNLCLYDQSCLFSTTIQASWTTLVVQMVKNLPAMQEMWVQSLSQRSHGEGNGYTLHCSCLETFMDRGAWWTTYNPWSLKESDSTEWLTLSVFHKLPERMNILRTLSPHVYILWWTKQSAMAKQSIQWLTGEPQILLTLSLCWGPATPVR